MRTASTRLPPSSHPPAAKSKPLAKKKNDDAAASKRKPSAKKAEKIASLIKEKKLIAIKRKTTNVIKKKAINIKPVKRLKTKSLVSTEVKVKPVKKVKTTERQASPKRGKSQSPARVVKTPSVVKKQPKKNVSPPVTRCKKQQPKELKTPKPSSTGLKRARKPLSTAGMTKDAPQSESAPPAEVIKKPTETAKKLAETSKKPAEMTKKPPEIAKKLAETAKKPAEMTKKPGETAKKTTEMAKKSAPEVTKKSAESAKKPVVEVSKKPAAVKKKRASSQDSVSSNPPEVAVKAMSPPPVKPVKKTKEKPAAKIKDNITKKTPKKIIVAKKPKITTTSQHEKSDYEKGVEEIDINESLIKVDSAEIDKKVKMMGGVTKNKVEIDQEDLKKPKKEKSRKLLVPPKKRPMAPLKKRLAARAALDMDFKPPVMPAETSSAPATEVVKREEYSSSDDATLDVVLRKFLQQRHATGKPTKKPAKSEPKPKKLVKKVESSSSAPSSPEPVTKKTKKGVKRLAKSPAAKKNSKIKALVAIKKRKLQVDKIRKKKKIKKGKKRYSSSGSESEQGGTRHSSSSDEERARRMKVFGFWSGPKKHRVASLNALAKVHCLYENEARPTPGMFSTLAVTASKSDAAVTTTTTTTTDICTRTLRSGPAGLRGAGRHWYDSASSSSDSSSSSDGPSGTLVPYRRRRNSSETNTSAPRKKPVSKPVKAPAPTPSSSTGTGRKVVRRKRCDMIMDLKDMVVRKRMASLNASAILAASYSFEKRTPNKSCTTSSVQLRVVKVQQQTSTTSIQKHVQVEEESDIDSTPTSPNQPAETADRNKKPATITSKRSSTSSKKQRRTSTEVKAPPKKRKRRATGDSSDVVVDDEDDPLAKVIKLRGAPKKVALIMNDTDVTITGVYVNTRSTEGYCISGMEYRISSTSHTQTEATTVLQRGPHPSQAGQQPPQPPPPPQEHVARHHHLHHHHHHHAPPAQQSAADIQGGYRGPGECDPSFVKPPVPPQSYTPLGALSSMQPPASLQQGGPGLAPSPQQLQPPMAQPPLRVHHGGPSPLGRHGSSAFSAPPSAYGGPPQPPPDAAPYMHGYYQPAGPLIHAGSELCRATSKLGGSSAPAPPQQPPSSLLLPPVEQEHHPEASTSSPLPPPPTHIVSSQGSPFRHYTPYPSYQYHPAPPQYYHPAQQSALVAASHHLAPPPAQDLCYSSCYSPHYKYPPAAYRRFPPQHFYPPQPDVYSALPGPSSASSFQPPPAPPPSSSSAPPSQHQEAGPSSAPPPGAYLPPPPHLSQQPPEPPPTYQFYPGYSPGPAGPPCYTHAPPPRGVAFLDASYQSCPCPMQSCPKNGHTGPLTGDSKGPGPQETLFVMPPVAAAAAAAHPTSANRGPLPPGHPPSPARGSSGGPPVAQGPSPPATQQSPEAPAWVAAEPTPPPSDDSSAPRGDADLCDLMESSTDVNQNYRGKKRRLSISSRLDTKKIKANPAEMMQQFPPLDNNNVYSAINEPLLITTTMLKSNQKLEESLIREDYDIKNNNVQMPILPPTPPTSTDTSPPPKLKTEKRPRAKTVRSRPSKAKSNLPSSTKRKQQQPRKRNTSMLKSHGIRDSPPQIPSPTVVTPTITPEPTEKVPKHKAKLLTVLAVPKPQTSLVVPKPITTPKVTSPKPSPSKPSCVPEPSLSLSKPSTSLSPIVLPCITVSKPPVTSPKTKLALSHPSPKARKSKLVPSATDVTTLPGNVTKQQEEEESVPEMKPPAPIKKGGKRKSSPSTSTSGKRSKKLSTAAALAAAREAEESAHNDLMKKVSLRKTLTPKWSNGWSWEGEPFQAKVFLRNDDSPVLRHCYPAMRHEEGDVVVARDCILLKSGTRKGDLPYVAKVASLWENPEDGEMMLSLLWYYRPEHTEKGRKPEDMSDEIFASKHKDNSSVACIEDKCYVLTFNEYCRYRASVRQAEEGALMRPLVVPQLPPELSTGREHRMPSSRVAPDLVFFCRKVYDFRQKRMLKNPG